MSVAEDVGLGAGSGFDFERAASAQGWLAELRGSHTPSGGDVLLP
jgi:hypothetical protein